MTRDDLVSELSVAYHRPETETFLDVTTILALINYCDGTNYRDAMPEHVADLVRGYYTEQQEVVF